MKILINTAVLCFAVLASILTGEGMLRLFWTNPFDFQVVGKNHPDLVFFAQPSQNNLYDIRGLYEGAKYARFRTGKAGEVLPKAGKTNPGIVFLGGSTTEVRYVNEGFRWPELAAPEGAMNYGFSGRSMMDIYFNMKFLLATHKNIKEAYIMEAVNDFSTRNNFGEIRWRETNRNNATNLGDEITADERHIYVLGLLSVFSKSLGEKREEDWVLKSYQNAVNPDQFYKQVPTRQFESLFSLRNESWAAFLKHRSEAIAKIVALARQNSVTVTFITQPNSYRDDYYPYQKRDLRVLPKIDENYLTISQTSQVLAQINENTLRAAKAAGAKVIDAAKHFEGKMPGDLFYDGVHFTEKGSIQLGEYVRTQRLW